MHVWPAAGRCRTIAPLAAGVQVGVGEDDLRRLAAELERHALERRAAAAAITLPPVGRAGEGDLVDAGVRDHRRAGVARRCRCTTLTDAGREARLLASARANASADDRRVLRRLEHDRVAGGERRRELPGRQHQRRVPRRDRADDADRLAPRVDSRAGPCRAGSTPPSTCRTPAEVLEAAAGDVASWRAYLADQLAVVAGLAPPAPRRARRRGRRAAQQARARSAGSRPSASKAARAAAPRGRRPRPCRGPRGTRAGRCRPEALERLAVRRLAPRAADAVAVRLHDGLLLSAPGAPSVSARGGAVDPRTIRLEGNRRWRSAAPRPRCAAWPPRPRSDPPRRPG